MLAAVSAHGASGEPFTVTEEIGLAHFGDPYTGEAEALQISPDGRYFAALTERGRIDLNRPEDTLRIYRVQDAFRFLGRGEGAEPPMPFWTFDRSTDKDGPIITHWRWLKDSSAVAFLERGAHGSKQLMLADLKRKTIEPMTPPGESISAFDIRDRLHYVYTTPDPGLIRRAAAGNQAAAIVGTGRSLDSLLFPPDKDADVTGIDRSELWAVVAGEPFRVKDQASGQALVLFTEGQSTLALSPDGQSLVTALAVAEIPPTWEKRYQPPSEAYPIRLHAGRQDLETFKGYRLASRYVRIELRSGMARFLADGPTGAAAGWDAGGGPSWSEDETAVVLPGAFITPDPHGNAHACVAVVMLTTGTSSCVEPIEGPSASGSYENSRYVNRARFADAEGQRLVVSHYVRGVPQDSTEYRRTAAGAWIVAHSTSGTERAASGSLEIAVRQALNDSPMLIATDSKTKASRIILNPNPQLADIALGEAAVYKWKDKAGRDWKGGLFKPVPYESGRRYPLVIQTHGFSESEFTPSGIYPTAFAARALAGAGLAVLQAPDCPVYDTPQEGPCNVRGYEAAVNELVKAGLVDSERIGIIGFSRSCFYVMEALTTSALHIKAASITDGVMGNYLQYLMEVDVPGFADDAGSSIIGARPFAAGLQLWLKRSPLFNMDKVTAALQVVAEGRSDLTFMWEPYAVMRYLHKPVDLVLLNNNEHILSNPSARLVSQGGTVDWMRFWLKDEEDPDPAKAEQYKRWRELRQLRITQNAGQAKAE